MARRNEGATDEQIAARIAKAEAKRARKARKRATMERRRVARARRYERKTAPARLPRA